jgi:hypothetical protein
VCNMRQGEELRHAECLHASCIACTMLAHLLAIRPPKGSPSLRLTSTPQTRRR